MHLDAETLATLRAARRTYGVSFIMVSDDLVDKADIARVVDVKLSRDNDETPIVDMTITQHYGALCGAGVSGTVCALTPGHKGSHHPLNAEDID